MNAEMQQCDYDLTYQEAANLVCLDHEVVHDWVGENWGGDPDKVRLGREGIRTLLQTFPFFRTTATTKEGRLNEISEMLVEKQRI